MADNPINPLTGKSFGGETPVKEIDVKTDKAVPLNPLTGEAFGISGRESSQNRSYIGGSKHRARDVGKQMMSQHSRSLGEDISKFTDYNVPLGQDLNWQELRARNQSTAEKWGNGLAKAGVTTLGAVAENTLGVVFGLGELATGGAYYDNAIGKAVDSTNEWMREEMPNYLTQEEQKMSTLSKLGTANFWADTVANGLGYSIGSIATMWMTGGGGLITKGVSAAAKGLGIYRATKAVINGTKLAQKLSKGASFVRAAQMLEAGALMSLSEASVEARETKNTVYADLVQHYMQENNVDNEGDIDSNILKEFEDVAYSAGNTNFVTQLPLLMGTNLLMFGKQVTGFKAASKASKDVAWDAVSKKAVSKLADQSVWKQALTRMESTAMGSLEEAGQEGFQFASGHFASSYHTDAYHNGGHGDMSKALMESMQETFGSQEGLESMFVGALTGGLMGSAQSTMGGEYSTRKTNAATLAKFANGGYLQNTEARYQTASRSAAAMEGMQKHLEAGDHKKFKDAQFRLISYQALEALERGGFDVMLEKLEDAKGLDPAQFMEHFGYQTQDKAGNALSLEDQTGGKSQSEVIDGLKTKLKNFKTTYDNVGEQFPLDDKTSGLPRMLMSDESRAAEDAVYKTQSALRSELVLSGAEVKDRTARMKSIQKTMGNIVDGSLNNKAASLTHYGKRGSKITPAVDGINSAELDGVLADQSEDSSGEIAAELYDAETQLKSTHKALQDTYIDLMKTDPIAAAEFAKQAGDYISLLDENVIAIDRYNKLSSDTYAQEQFEKERIKAEDIAKKKAVDLKVDEAIKNSKTAAGLKAAMPSEGYSAEAKAKSNAKYTELKAAEKVESDKFYKSSLAELEAIDRDTLSEVELEGLKNAIEIKKGQQAKADRATEADANAKAKAEGTSFGFESESTATINEDGESITENPEYEKKQQELEEAFGPDNVGDVEAISEDGRTFQIDGEEYHNVEPNTLDAIARDKDGNITGINLVNSNGEHTSIFGPENRVDALAYSILMAEQLKVDGFQELSKEEIFEKLAAFEEEIAVEVSTAGDRGKHGLKTSELLREEIYSLERGLQEALEVHDQLRTYYIQEAGATKEDLKNDPDLKALKRKVNSIRAQIGARKRILKMRKEDTIPSSAEILKVERAALDKIEGLEESLSKAESETVATQEEVDAAEKAIADAKAADDVDAHTEASKTYRLYAKMLEEAKKLVKSIKRKINYHKKKLKRLADEKANELPGDAEQAAPETSGETEGQIDERKDTSTPAKPQKAKADVNRVIYTKKGKTGVYNVSLDANGEVQVFTSQSVNPVQFAKGQEADRMKIIGKWYVQTGNAVVVPHNGKIFIVIHKGATKNGKTGIIQEDGTYVNADTVNDDIKKKAAYTAIIAKANEAEKARVADESSVPGEQAVVKGAESEAAVVSIKKTAAETKGVPGAPKGNGGMQVMSEKELADLLGEAPATDEVDPNDPLEGVFGPQPTLEEQIEKAKEKAKPAPTPITKPAAPVESSVTTQDDFVRAHTFDINSDNHASEQAAVNFMISDALKAGMDWKLGPRRSDVHGRPIVEILMPNGIVFLMYRSTGTGTGAESVNKWVPIPGFARDGHFIKVYDKNGKNPKFTKYDVPLFQNIANALESLDAQGVDILGLEAGWKPKATPVKKSHKVRTVYHHTKVSNEDFNFDRTDKGDAQVSQFGNGLNAASETNPFFVKRYGDPIELDVNEADFIDIDASMSEAELFTHLTSLGYEINTPQNASGKYNSKTAKAEYDSTEPTNTNPAVIMFFNDFQQSNPKVKGVRVKNHIIGTEKVKPFYVIYDAKSFKATPKVAPKAKTTFGVKSASDAHVLMEDGTDMAGNPVRRSKLEVSEDGVPVRNEPDSVDGVAIPMDKTLLSSGGPLTGREVTFEIIVNDYAKGASDRQSPANIPIYYKLDGVIVGKLEAGSSAERASLVEALQNGEDVRMQVSDVIAGNFNHSRTSDGGKFFSNPAEVFDNPILVFTEVVEDHPQWTLGSEYSDKDVTPKMTSEIFETDNSSVNFGQVGIVVPENRTPQGVNKISMASTADLSPLAQSKVMKLLGEGKFEVASEIVANSLFSDSASWSTSFLEFGDFKGGAGFMVYKSPSTGELIRITTTNMQQAALGKTYKADIVALTADEQAFVKTKEVPDTVDVLEDITNFVKAKKYHVSRDLGNASGPYKSPVTGIQHGSYQDYLFSSEEIGTERAMGKGHHSILTTDMVELDGSLFHNPQIEFDGGNLKVSSPREKIAAPAEKTTPVDVADDLGFGGEGMNFGDQSKKDEMDQGCPF